MPRRPSPQPGPGSTSYLDRVRWVEVSNENAEDAPGGALLMVTGGGTDDGDSADDYGVPTVDRPNADGMVGLLIAHPAGIPAGGRGLASPSDFVPVAYDDADTPAVGETWGSAAGSWLLTKDMAGWRVAAPAVASQDLKLVECWRAAAGGSLTSEMSWAAPGSISAATGVFVDITAVAFPSAGTYLVTFAVATYGDASVAGAYLMARAKVDNCSDPSGASGLVGKMWFGTCQVAGVVNYASCSNSFPVTVSAAGDLTLQVARVFASGTYGVNFVSSGPSNATGIGWVKIG